MAAKDEKQLDAASQAEPTGRLPGIVLTPEQLRRRRQRNLAIGLTIGFLVLLFYAVTIVKLGPAVLIRPL